MHLELRLTKEEEEEMVDTHKQVGSTEVSLKFANSSIFLQHK